MRSAHRLLGLHRRHRRLRLIQAYGVVFLFFPRPGGPCRKYRGTTTQRIQILSTGGGANTRA
ncbi:Uncharacterised protein [Mycobacteroides abscessus subsp. abscessus]|nr:Uncharacterised protein [Mycobacteroides abscessus subsp. abscessus]